MIIKISAAQFANLQNNFEGVTLVYRSTSREGEVRESAVVFSGENYTPNNKTQDEIFRVWKNVIQTFWNVKILEKALKEDNGGIATKLRSTTPAAIIVRTADSKQSVQWDVESSIWSRIGIVPTKRDMEEASRDYKKKMHKAAKASFDALNFRAKFDDETMPEMERAEVKED